MNKEEFGKRKEEIEKQISLLSRKIRDALVRHMAGKSLDSLDELEGLNVEKEMLRSDLDRLIRQNQDLVYSKKVSELDKRKFKYFASLCLIIKDENTYLKEWLEWHARLGADHFYIYDHGSRERVADFIKTLDRALQEKAEVLDFGGRHHFAQMEAYADCLKRARDESRWLGYIDTDEFIVFRDRDMRLKDFLDKYKTKSGVFMRWTVFGANGQVARGEGTMMERFKEVSPCHADDGMGKTFVQPSLVQRMYVHNGIPIDGGEIVDENNEPTIPGHSRKEGCTAEIVSVNHYYTKSYEEWVEKIKRGSCDPIYGRKFKDFFMYNPDLSYLDEGQEDFGQLYEGKKTQR